MDNNLNLTGVKKQSERVFVSTVADAEKKARTANRVYHAVSKGVLSFGIAVAVALPLSMLPAADSSDPDGVDSYETNNFFNTPPGGVEPLKLEAVIKNELEYAPHSHESGVSGARINVAGPNIVISAVPPLNKEWHRSVFEKQGDSLWALPDVDLVIRLGEDLAQCSAGGCDARFDLESQQYLGGTVEGAFTLTSASPSIESKLDGRCETDPRQPAVKKCRLADQHSNRHLCLWLRKSTVPGLIVPPQVALDVKWNFMDLRDNECIDRLNETRYRER